MPNKFLVGSLIAMIATGATCIASARAEGMSSTPSQPSGPSVFNRQADGTIPPAVFWNVNIAPSATPPGTAPRTAPFSGYASPVAPSPVPSQATVPPSPQVSDQHTTSTQTPKAPKPAPRKSSSASVPAAQTANLNNFAELMLLDRLFNDSASEGSRDNFSKLYLYSQLFSGTNGTNIGNAFGGAQNGLLGKLFVWDQLFSRDGSTDLNGDFGRLFFLNELFTTQGGTAAARKNNLTQLFLLKELFGDRHSVFVPVPIPSNNRTPASPSPSPQWPQQPSDNGTSSPQK